MLELRKLKLLFGVVAEQQQKMGIKYICLCPMGDECGKKGRRLGAFDTREAAMAKVVHHLLSSANHQKMSKEEAEGHADGQEYEEEDWAEEEVESAVSNELAKNAKGWNKQGNKQSWDKGGWKADGWKQPAKPPGPYAGSKASDSAASSAMANISINASRSAEFLDCVQSLARSEASARTAARVARAAAGSFEDEACTLSMALKKLKDFVGEH